MIRKQICAALLLTVMGILGSTGVQGQVAEVPPEGVHGSTPLRVVGYGFYDYHYATDGVGGGALMADWRVSQTFTLCAGVEYASSNRIASKLGGSATLRRMSPTLSSCWPLKNEKALAHRRQLQMRQRKYTGMPATAWRRCWKSTTDAETTAIRMPRYLA